MSDFASFRFHVPGIRSGVLATVAWNPGFGDLGRYQAMDLKIENISEECKCPEEERKSIKRVTPHLEQVC
jgi:hypothetical protein